MRVKLPGVIVRVLLFGLLLCASSTAYADTVAITNFNFITLTFNPATGTAVFTPTGATARAAATNSLGQNQDITTTTFPVAQTTAVVTFANTTVTTNAAGQTASATSVASVAGCTCTASSFGIGVFTGTLLLLGGEGNVNVTLSLAHFATGQVSTDQFGTFAFAEVSYNVLVNGRGELSQDQMLREVEGPNQTGGFNLGGGGSRVLSLQFGVPHTIELRMSSVAAVTSEVPEPTTVVLLVSGLGFMTGVLKKRRKKID
ncbi:MAG: PEP-CTERM sorting domain-containing protein [Acidobacteria bacterium]|nr:PEP-CTERM sorting domain-containing protein [Acidobacteriota bacterium]